MSATNGSALLRSRSRLIGCCAVLVALVAAMFASNANAAKTPLTPSAYIAIGDSISFGYKEQTFYTNQGLNKSACEAFDQEACEPASSFEPGFVGEVAKKLARVEKQSHNELKLFNLACPGETSDGVIGHLLGNEEAAYDPCGYHNTDGFPLKYNYGTASQLEAAAGIVESGIPVKLVTINIGSNDELAIVAKCESPAYLAEQGFSGGLDECIVTEAGLSGHEYPGGLFTHIIENVGTIAGVLREVGYTGPIDLLGFYNPQAELLPGSDALQIKLNEAFEGEIALQTAKHEEPFGSVTYVNPFDTFNFNTAKKNGAKSEQAHLEKYTEEFNAFDKKINLEKLVGHEVTAEEAAADPEGDIHPTAAGYKAIAKLVWATL